MGSTHKSMTRQMLKKRGSQRTAMVQEEKNFTVVRKAFYFLCPIHMLKSVLSLISGLHLPSQASRPPAVMGESTSSSGFPGLLLC